MAPNMHFPTRPSNLAEIITFCINSSCQRYFCFFRIRVRVTVRVRVRVDRPAPNPVPQAPKPLLLSHHHRRPTSHHPRHQRPNHDGVSAYGGRRVGRTRRSVPAAAGTRVFFFFYYLV